MKASVETGPSPDVARVGLLYRETMVPVAILAAALGLGPGDFYRRLAGWGWSRRRPGRRPPAASGGRPSEPAERAAPAGAAQALEGFIADRLAALRAEASRGRDADPERTARTVAQYARALQVLQTTLARNEKETSPDDAEPPARSLSELRDELRGHLERIRDESRARRRARRPPPDAG